MIPGLVAAILMLSVMAIMSQAVVRSGERHLGADVRHPITRGEYLIGKVTPYVLLAVLQMTVVALVGIFWFRVPFNGTFAGVAAGLGLFLLTVIGLGLLVSLASHTRQQAQQTILFIMLPMMLLSGFIFPIESMPAALVPLTYAMPLTWAVPLLRGAFVKGVGFSALVPELLVLALGVVIFGVAVLATRRRLSE